MSIFVQKDVFDEFADEIRTSQSNLETDINSREPAISPGTTAQFWRGDKTWQDFGTGVRSTVLTGLTAVASAAIVAADTTLVALAKLQAQVSAAATLASNANTNANGREPAFTKNTAFNRNFGTANPAALGTASPGNSNDVARINHVHPLPPSPTRVAFAYTSGNTGDVLTSYYFRTQENVVFLVGNVTRAAGGFAGNTHIINLPVGFRPPAGSHVHCAGLLFRSADPVASLMHPAIVAVRPGGAIEVVAVSNVANDITDLIFMMSFRT